MALVLASTTFWILMRFVEVVWKMCTYTRVAHVMRVKVHQVRMRNKFILPTSQLVAVNKEGWALVL